MKTCINTTLISSGVLCIILMVLGFIFGSSMLKIINTPKDIFSDSLLYLNIYTAGLLFLFFYNIATGIFSAMGDSRTPFIFLAFSSTANIAVDIIFTKGLNMGILGIACATFLCQGVSCILAVVTIFVRLSKIKVHGKVQIFSRKLAVKIGTIAVPSILQQSFISIGNIVIQSIINSFGAGVIAGYAAAIKLNNLVITSFSTLGNGMSNFTAQNIGAKKMDRIKSGCRGGLIMVYTLYIPIVIIYLLFSRYLVSLFMNNTTGLAMNTGIQFLKIVSPFYFVVATKLIVDGILRGASAMKLFMVSTFTDLVLRVILAGVFSKSMGVIGIWCAWPIGWIIAAIISVVFYMKGSWKKPYMIK